MGKAPYILSEISNLSIVSEPLRRSSRIKYTCFNVSQNYLVFGASSGGLYVFKREPCTFSQLLPSTEGAVSLVSISPCETFAAFSTARGSLCVVGLESKIALRHKRIAYEYDSTTITAIQWSVRSSEVYVGDSVGRISVVSLLLYMGQSVFQLSHAPLVQLDSRVVQMDMHSHLLLVSTLSRSYLCDTLHEQYRQIGSQLRDGLYGACFHNVGEEEFQISSDIEKEGSRYLAPFSSLREGERLLSDERLRNVRVYCARPGLRLWEVLIDGSVLNTHQLKRALAVPPSPVLGIDKAVEEITAAGGETRQQSFNFSKLYRAVENKFLLAFHSDGFYLLDPGADDVITWTDSFSGIIDVKVVNNEIYLWCSDGRLHAVTVTELDSFLVQLYLQTRYELCAELISDYEKQLAAMVNESPQLQFLPELAKKIKDEYVVVPDGIASVIDSLAQTVLTHSQERQKAVKLESGIFLVENNFSSAQINSSQPKIEITSYKDPHLENRKVNEALNRNGCENDGNLLKTDDDLRSTSSRDSSDVENSVDDLDDVFQVMGITKQEMKIALKEMGNTITDTFNSSTRSVRKNLRLLVMKQKLAWATANGLNSFPSDVEIDANIYFSAENRRRSPVEWKGTPNTGINKFIEACENVSNHNSTDRRSFQECVFQLLESMIFLCDQYDSLTPEDINDVILGRRNEPVYEYPGIKDIFSRWLRRKEDKNTFYFPQIFDEDILIQIRTHLHGSLKSGTLIAWIRNNLPDVSENGQLFPDFMRNMYNENEFLIDRILSHFLKTTASLLDPFIILQCLSACKSPCIYLSWNQIMELCQHGKLHKEVTLVDDVRKEWPLPVTLNSILIMLDLRQVEYCSAAPIKDVVYIILRLQSKEIKSGKPASVVYEQYGTLFMKYLDAVPPSDLSRGLDDAEIRMFVLSLFEKLRCFKNNFDSCSCGFPQPFTNDDLAKHRLPFKNVCKTLILWLRNNDKEKLDECCRTNPLIWPLVLGARRNDSLKVLLPIIIQMGSFLELEHRLSEMNDELWTSTFHLCVTLGENACLNCCQPLKRPLKVSDEIQRPDHWRLLWQRFAELLLRKLGPREATRLLGDHKDIVPQGTIDLRFVKLCAISSLLDPSSGNLSRHIVDTLTNAPRKIPNIPAFSQSSVEQLKKESFSADLLPLPSAKTSSSHHWGIKINFREAVCPFCLLALGSSVLVEKGGVAVFKCAHSFHTICLQRCIPQKYSGCPLCHRKAAET